MRRRILQIGGSQKHCPYTPWALLLAFVSFAGCGGDGGPARYAYSGAAMFNGEPIPAGEIRFVPDTSKANSGPGSVARIQDGQYATAEGKGLVGGAYVIAVSGYGAVPSGPRDETAPDWGLPLFPEYEMAVELPQEDSEYDIEVPADAAR